jgi:nucleotide-binding universal stress UspA family protein
MERVMSNPILVPFDGSESAERALVWAADAARGQQCPVHLLAVVEWSYFGVQNPMELAQAQAVHIADVQHMREKVLAPRAEQLRGAGIAVEQTVEPGPVTATILDIAERTGARMIVVGRRGGSRLSKLLMGSTSSALVQTAPVPVVVVP